MKRAVILLLVLCVCLSSAVVHVPAARADASLAWEQIGQPMGKVWWPVVDPKDANHVYVVAEQGLYRSFGCRAVMGANMGRQHPLGDPDSLHVYIEVSVHLQSVECILLERRWCDMAAAQSTRRVVIRAIGPQCPGDDR